MAQYIDKDAVVAEIYRRIALLESIGSEAILHDNYPVQYAMLATLKSLNFSINSLEMREVDLDKAARNYLLNEHLSPLNELMHKADLKAEMQYHKDIENAYKAGFNFALKAQKGE